MLRLAAKRVVCARSAQNQLLVIAKANYIRGYWPEPITQQKLDEFLRDINYFDEPQKVINIGLELPKVLNQEDDKSKSNQSQKVAATQKKTTTPANTSSVSAVETEDLDQLFDTLGKEAAPEELDFDDVPLAGEQVTPLAFNYGIYRDLFRQTPFKPDTEVRFTREQAERLNKLVPYFWITDQPFARVDRKPKEPEPIHYFNPVTGISARFVREEAATESKKSKKKESEKSLVAHRSYYGNIIPACEAQQKPSITLDGILTSPKARESLTEKDFDNWQPGTVSLANFSSQTSNSLYHSIILLNLDPPMVDTSIIHWMVANIKPKATKGNILPAVGEELCEYLPIYGVRGFGYSRYVFLAFQHDSPINTSNLKINESSLDSRRFSTKTFMEKNSSANLKPVGLSWFQTTWDESSNRVFHDYLNSRAPIYEHVQQKETGRERQPYPGKVPFNVYLDHVRDKKEINEQVLLERLKTTDPFEGYKDQYVPPKVPETVFDDDEKMPSWMKTVMFKKKNKIGPWRGLRPASATLPLDNNADLDHPLRPLESPSRAPPEFPNEYPGKPKYKLFKDSPLSRPVNEFQNVFIQENHKIDMDWVKEMMAKADKQDPAESERKSKSKKQKQSSG